MCVKNLLKFVNCQQFVVHKLPNIKYHHFVNVFCFFNDTMHRQEDVSIAQSIWKQMKAKDSTTAWPNTGRFAYQMVCTYLGN